MKHFLSTNLRAAPIIVAGKEIKFSPAVYMQATNTDWGTYSTDDPAEIEALSKKGVPFVSEISEEDNDKLEIQRRNRADYSTIINYQQRGIGTDPKGSVAAVTVDDPIAAGLKAAPVEAVDDILATKVASKKAR